jgi:nicotinate phosphoribosyltransferase
MLSTNPSLCLGLFTDLYQLTMLQAYVEEGMEEEGVFSLFVRRLPERRNFLLACGLDDALTCLESFGFDREALEYLDSLGLFSKSFLDYLEGLRFAGDVYAVAEGTPIFANEPILEVVASLPEAQCIETLLMNQIHLQTLLASKAIRVITAAQGRPVVDFGLRRIHGIDAGLKAARALHIAGVVSTSNVAAGKMFGIPVAGTMAHSYIQAHDDEAEAFRRFADLYPETVLLVDTYDTLDGVRKVIRLARELGANFKIRAIRLDSGDLGELARQSRRMLDEAGLQSVGIFASGSLDEDVIAELLSAGAPIDAFGVGTKMGVSEDAPSLDIAYKLVSYAGRGRIKLSAGKQVLPGRKQVFRFEDDGLAVKDVIACDDEVLAARPLLKQVMRRGQRVPEGRGDIQAARRNASCEVARLPERIRALKKADPAFPVEVSNRLTEERNHVAQRFAD